MSQPELPLIPTLSMTQKKKAARKFFRYRRSYLISKIPISNSFTYHAHDNSIAIFSMFP